MKYVFTKEGNYLIIVGNKSYQTIKDQCNSFFSLATLHFPSKIFLFTIIQAYSLS